MKKIIALCFLQFSLLSAGGIDSGTTALVPYTGNPLSVVSSSDTAVVLYTAVGPYKPNLSDPSFCVCSKVIDPFLLPFAIGTSAFGYVKAREASRAFREGRRKEAFRALLDSFFAVTACATSVVIMPFQSIN